MPVSRSRISDTGSLELVMHHPDETMRFGESIGRAAEPDTVVALVGDLATGKTMLAKGVALGAGVPAEEYVTSPAYDLVHEYMGRLPVFHMDFYRIDALEPEDYEWIWEYFARGGISVIEWADKIGALLPDSHLRIELDYGAEREERLLSCSAIGEPAARLLDALRAEWL